MRLRILQVASGLRGWAGTERYILDLSPRLAERGHDVTIACQPGSEIARRSAELGLPLIHLATHREYDWRQFPKFVRALGGRFDVVNIHGLFDYIIPAVAAKLRGVPAVVMTRHLPHPFRNRLTAAACSEAVYDAIIAVSDFVHNILIKSGARQERTFTVKNGIDTRPWLNPDANTFRETLRIPRDSFLAAAAGRLSPAKGFDTLVGAVGKARRQGLDVHCVIAGSGDSRELEEVRRHEGLDGSVHLIGFSRDVPNLYGAADVVVVPSVRAESFPYAALEGLASGRPVVASRIGGLPEIVTPETGILFPPGDVGALASALSGLARDARQCRALGHAAQTRALQFTIDSMVGGVEAVYQSVVTRKRSAPHRLYRRGQ